MGLVGQAMRVLVDWVLQASWQAAIIVAVVLLLQWIFERRLPARWRYALWGLVVVRLVMPAMPGSRLSMYNLLGSRESKPVIASVEIAPPGDLHQSNTPGNEIVLPPLTPHERTWWADWDWRTVAGIVWLSGAMVLAGAILQSHARLRRRIARSGVAGDAGMLGLLDECKREMRVSGRVDLVMSDAVSSPALMGLWHAKLLVPSGLAKSLTLAELRFIFLHELAHHKCCDIALDWVLAGLRVIHWFNPVLWLGLSRLRADRELARDAMVLAVTGGHYEESYGQTILRLVEQFGYRETGLGAVGLGDGKGQLKRRIGMIARFNPNMVAGAMLGLILIVAVACIMLTGPAPSAKDDGQSAPAAKGVLRGQGTQAMNAAQAALDQRLAEVKFDDVPLADAIQSLAGRSKVDIRVDWANVEAAGVRRDKRVEARAHDVTLFTALTKILDHAAGGKSKLACTAADGGILVSTIAEVYKSAPRREYPIGDLMISAAVAGMPNPVGAVPGPDDVKRFVATDRLAERAKEIILLIQETVDPESWTQGASIRKSGATLVVTTIEENHRKIASLLSKLRETHSIVIDLQFRMVDIDEDVLEDVLAGFAKEGEEWARLTPVAMSNMPTSSTQPTRRTAILNDQQVDRLLRALRKDPKTRNVTAPRLTAFNGLQGVVAVGSNRPYIANIKAGKDADGKTTYSQEKSSVLDGIRIATRPTVSADRKQVAISLEVSQTALKGLVRTPFPADKSLYTEMPQVDVRMMETRATVPDRGTLLVTGFKQKSTTKGDGKDVKNLLLLVTPTIVSNKPGGTDQLSGN